MTCQSVAPWEATSSGRHTLSDYAASPAIFLSESMSLGQAMIWFQLGGCRATILGSRLSRRGSVTSVAACQVLRLASGRQADTHPHSKDEGGHHTRHSSVCVHPSLHPRRPSTLHSLES